MTDLQRRYGVRMPTASPAEVAAEASPFPVTTPGQPLEAFFPDWRQRLARNLSRRSDSRWEPLTWIHCGPEGPLNHSPRK
jgi:hypothetical protein